MYKELKEFTQSNTFRGIIVGIVVAIIALLIFQAGMHVGYRKASFSFRFGDNYYRAFGDQGGPKLFHMPLRGGFIESHGAVGQIVSINLPTFVVADPKGIEKVVLINDSTVIRQFDQDLTPDDLGIDNFTVVLGSPNEDSQIEAKLIRILPPPPEREIRRKRIR